MVVTSPSRAVKSTLPPATVKYVVVVVAGSVAAARSTLLPSSTRGSRSWGFALCLFWLLTYYGLLSLGKALGDKGVLPPTPALWLPNVAVGSIALYLFTRAMRESPLAMTAALDRAFAWVGRSMMRSRTAR